MDGVLLEQELPSVVAARCDQGRYRRAHIFLINNFTPVSEVMVTLYCQRWQVELFSKWIKYHRNAAKDDNRRLRDHCHRQKIFDTTS